MSRDEANAMDEIIPNLWIGDLRAATDEQLLREHNIHSVLSAMRGRVKVHETFTHFQVQLDDTTDADALAFFPQCISFIDGELEGGRGVLVHCQAGMSRSATIVAAYIMYAKETDVEGALQTIVEARPSVQPNDGFLEQLEVFYRASYKISRWNKAMRMYYLERALDEIINGDGSIPKDNMFAKFPRSPSDSAPATPGGSGGPRRRIRCKMCRQELAAREHMLDHGQVGPGTPASVFAFSPAASRRTSSTAQDAIRPAFTPLASMSRRGSAGAGAGTERPIALATLNGEPIPLPLPLRRFSGSSASSRPESPVNLSRRPSRGARRGSLLANEVSPSGLVGATIPEGVAVDDSSAIADDDDDDDEVDNEGHGGDADDTEDVEQRERHTNEAELNGADGKDANGSANATTQASPTEANAARTLRRSGSNSGSGSNFMSPMDLAAQLNAHPKLAALRSPALGGIGGLQPMTPLTPLTTSSSVGTASTATNVGASTSANSLAKLAAVRSPPLLINSTCSGYFLEPMKWMEPFLEDGQLAGKIVCPNKKCGAKLGNYDWAGVCCSCKEWVTPGFCIHRSKVDEVV